jgi:propanol-preferring alcohol dehydrogenase
MILKGLPMKAAILRKPCTPFVIIDVPVPTPRAHQVLIRVSTCGICRTDLHIIDGELPSPKWPLICGHQIVGTVAACGECSTRFAVDDRIGVPWLASTCGVCSYCKCGRENLCDQARFTGYTVDGGFAEFAVADERFSFPIPSGFGDKEASPLLCAGLIGFRALSFAGEARRIGLYGFGAAAHIITQTAVFLGKDVYAFTRKNDNEGQAFARSLGAAWAGAVREPPPEPLDAAIIFAPAGELVPLALRACAKGGSVICAGIHMSDIPAFSYDILWGERSIRSVANLTRKDGEKFLPLAAAIPIKTSVTVYPLVDINRALDDHRSGTLKGSAVIQCC